MKKYEEVFQCELPVQLLATKLLGAIHMKPAGYDQFVKNIEADPQNFLNEEVKDEDTIFHDCIQYRANLEYYTKLAESIVDSIKENGQSCAHVFNTLNGWVKTETPSEREYKTLHQQTQDACDNAIEALAKSKDEDDLAF